MHRRLTVTALLALTALAAAACGSTTEDSAATTVPPPSGETVAAVPSAGCGSSGVGAVTEERREVTVTDPDTGAPRWFLVTTPPNHDGTTPVPLVLDFHGLSEGAVVHALHSKMSEFAAANGFAVAFPQGTGTPVRWNALPTSDGPSLSAENDLAYVDAILDQLEATLCIDTARVYATGLSNGAGMTSLLACVRADRFAAAAPVAGVRAPIECDEATTTPVMAFHGTVDPILFYNGGIGDLAGLLGGSGDTSAPDAVLDGEGYPAAARAWAQHNGCDPEPAKSPIGTDVEHWVFTCPAGNEVEFFAIIGGGHTWPGSAFSESIENITGPTSFTISANEEMWSFFKRHALQPS